MAGRFGWRAQRGDCGNEQVVDGACITSGVDVRQFLSHRAISLVDEPSIAWDSRDARLGVAIDTQMDRSRCMVAMSREHRLESVTVASNPDRSFLGFLQDQQLA